MAALTLRAALGVCARTVSRTVAATPAALHPAAAAAAVTSRRMTSIASLTAARQVVAPASALAAAPVRLGSQVRGLKTKSSIKKRFRVKPNGSIVRKKAGRRHLMMNKDRAHMNRLGKMAVVSTPGIRRRYLALLNTSPLKGR